jgi:hypothetical protein
LSIKNFPLQARVLVNQDNFDATLWKGFFRDAPGVADAVGAFAVHTLGGFHAGRFQDRMANGIGRRRSTRPAG